MAFLARTLSRGFVPSATSLQFSRASSVGTFKLPNIKNEPDVHYEVSSQRRHELRSAIERLKSDCPDIPCIIGGKEIRTGSISKQVMPTNHGHALCNFHTADAETLNMAVEASMEAKKEWENLPGEERFAVYLKAADLLSTKYRAELCAAVMLGQGKNVWQAEIDCAMELIDFWRFNAKYASEMYTQQPSENSFGVWNRTEYRPLEGFVLAIAPFNFAAISGNLHSAPGIMGNTCIWKPASTSILSAHVIYRILTEAGMPPGVVNFTPGSGRQIAPLVKHRDLGGLHFTGSTAVFNHICSEIGNNLDNYKSYPRVVGETGGKNFHFVHESADIENAVFNTIRGSFEYQGQKCSATSRAYIPKNRWGAFKNLLLESMETIKMGCTTEFDSFVTAVIDEASFDSITPYIDRAKASDECEIIAGGGYDKSKGYFIEPTVILTTNPQYETMREELFGPVLTIYVYDENKLDETIEEADNTSIYALTGSIFARDRRILHKLTERFRHSAGNFYINDKSTGAVVGQQPFGGSRASGTNDKSGSGMNLLRWVSVRSIKENHVPLRTYRYPHMEHSH